MKYYNFELESEPKIIGVRNGIYQVELDRKAYDKETYKQIELSFIRNKFTAEQIIPDVNFNFYFKKLKSAKKTSFMSFTPYLKHGHFLVQKNTLGLFKNFNVQKYKAYESVIYDSPNENLDNNYQLFYCVLKDWEVIDFENTVFTSGGFGNNPKIEHKFSNENDMRNFNGITSVKTLALTKSFDNTLDFFHTRLGGLFVSERLKTALEESSATGMVFREKIEVII
ncbi:MAG: hypothetical protein LBE37_19305 [Sphingobacterium sp.]|jgi:hypothetical protein|nr:hypothetical protein [Sphingobacterium sp.]